jgi:ElaB/YqjD/DUF883 family membrane-anchored ribosome-binding protein
MSDRPVPVPRTGVPLGIDDPVAKARAELKAALAAIEVKANLPKRIEHESRRFVERAREFRRVNPVAAAATVVGVAATVGGLVWLAVRSYTR